MIGGSRRLGVEATGVTVWESSTIRARCNMNSCEFMTLKGWTSELPRPRKLLRQLALQGELSEPAPWSGIFPWLGIHIHSEVR